MLHFKKTIELFRKGIERQIRSYPVFEFLEQEPIMLPFASRHLKDYPP